LIREVQSTEILLFWVFQQALS